MFAIETNTKISSTERFISMSHTSEKVALSPINHLYIPVIKIKKVLILGKYTYHNLVFN